MLYVDSITAVRWKTL